MAIFRLQENVPDVYPRKSRDFQLLCNTFDAMFNAIKYDIDSITRTADTRLCSDRLLPLLQTKLGFFSNKHFTTEELRTVLQAFKYVVKDKGSRTGIIAAIQVFLKVANASNRSKIIVMDNYIGKDDYSTDAIVGNTYIVEVAIEGKQVDTTLLTELLKYVLPAGYRLQYSFYTAMEPVSRIRNRDTIEIAFVNIGDSRGVRATTANDATNRYPYELTFTTHFDDEDGKESYFFIRSGDTYQLLEEIPHGWPNGEYYKRVTGTKTYYPIVIETGVSPAFEAGAFYWIDPVTSVKHTLDRIPDNWGQHDAVYYYSESDEQVTFTWTYIPLIESDNEYLKDEEGNCIFFTKVEGTFTVTTDLGASDIHVATRPTHYERVYLPHNSINGISTTSTHPAKTNTNARYDYSTEQGPDASIPITNI